MKIIKRECKTCCDSGSRNFSRGRNNQLKW